MWVLVDFDGYVALDSWSICIAGKFNFGSICKVIGMEVLGNEVLGMFDPYLSLKLCFRVNVFRGLVIFR
jgi:hypothetical protein